MGKTQYPLFKQIDIFGISPLFTIRGRATFQTQIGSFLTIICVMLIVIYISIFFNEMINHKSPNIQSTIYYDETPSEIQLKKKNFIFIFGLKTKDNINFIDERIYNVEGNQIKINLSDKDVNNYENDSLNIIKCSEYKFELSNEIFKKLPLDNLYCIDNDLNLKGEYMSKFWNYVRLNFSKCQNLTENQNFCKSDKEINEILNGGYIEIYIPDYNFEPIKYNDPYNIYIRNLYKSFSIKYFEDIFLYFKLVEIITDSGFFFENKKKINITSYDYIQNDIDFRDYNHFLSISVRVSSKREIYERSYIKLQTIFSNVGGMLKILLLIGEYIVYFIRMTLYKNYILEFFNLDESEIRLKKIRKKYNLPGNLNLKNHTMFSNMNNIIENNNSFIVKKNNNDILESNLGNIIEENSESKSFTNSKIKNSFILTGTKKTVQNNYLLKKNEFLCEKSKSKENKNTFNLLYRNSNKEEESNLNSIFLKKEKSTLSYGQLISPKQKKTASLLHRPLYRNSEKKDSFLIHKNSNRNDIPKKTSSVIFNINDIQNNLNSKKNSIFHINSIISNSNHNFFKNKVKSDNLHNNYRTKYSSITELKRRGSDISDNSYIIGRKSGKQQLFIPKTNLRIIKVPGFCTDFVCKKNTLSTIKQVHENYKEIQFLLDIVHYLKSQNEISIIEKYVFSEEQRKVLSYTYTFEADFGLERKGYEYMIKHKKNKFDDKEMNETTSQNQLLALQNKSEI